MNAKQTIPLIATLAPTIAPLVPPLLIIGGLFLLAKWLSSDEHSEPKPETAPATAAPERQGLRVPLVSGGNTVQNRYIPPNSGGKPSAMPTSTPVPVGSASAVPKIPVPPASVIPAVKIQPQIPSPARKKFIRREDMAKIFNGGNRGLTRKSAVAALKVLGFGKTAAYEALAINGRFMSWLQFAPDGIITWKV